MKFRLSPPFLVDGRIEVGRFSHQPGEPVHLTTTTPCKACTPCNN